ncbi:MAG: type VI secretion system lipoprotein TssJ [Nannocystaceae bacterium]|nr:type VI secretion system lipoprotein TssJ [Myxococcales bacterium]
MSEAARVALACALMLPLVACAGRKQCEAMPPNLSVTIDGESRLNQDSRARSLPTRVRLYLLRKPTTLDQASFEDVWRRDKETLGEELLHQQEEIVYPGQTVTVSLEPEDDVRYVAAVGIFREPAGSSWRALYRLPRDVTCTRQRPPTEDDRRTLVLMVKLDANAIRLRPGAVIEPGAKDKSKERGVPSPVKPEVDAGGVKRGKPPRIRGPEAPGTPAPGDAATGAAPKPIEEVSP